MKIQTINVGFPTKVATDLTVRTSLTTTDTTIN